LNGSARAYWAATVGVSFPVIIFMIPLYALLLHKEVDMDMSSHVVL
jgi:hypothetical protein